MAEPLKHKKKKKILLPDRYWHNFRCYISFVFLPHTPSRHVFTPRVFKLCRMTVYRPHLLSGFFLRIGWGGGGEGGRVYTQAKIYPV